MLYACPKLCHITNGKKDRCPNCGEWLVSAGEDNEENRERMKKEAIEKQMAYKEKFSRFNTV